MQVLKALDLDLESEQWREVAKRRTRKLCALSVVGLAFESIVVVARNSRAAGHLAIAGTGVQKMRRTRAIVAENPPAGQRRLQANAGRRSGDYIKDL